MDEVGRIVRGWPWEHMRVTMKQVLRILRQLWGADCRGMRAEAGETSEGAGVLQGSE